MGDNANGDFACLLVISFIVMCVLLTSLCKTDILILEEAAYCDEGFFYVRLNPKLHVVVFYLLSLIYFIFYRRPWRRF